MGPSRKAACEKGNRSTELGLEGFTVKSPEERVLERFVVDNPELEQLEALLAEFNIFEALGAVRQELRHSDYLAFLLNPSKQHGLGDAFLKRFLKTVLLGSDTETVNPVEIDVSDLDHVEVRREWNCIDILMVDSTNRWVTAIENKVDAAEAEEQLRRYREGIQRDFPTHRHLLLFLTPEGRKPSDDAWSPVNYGTIATLVDKVKETHQSTLGSAVAMLMEHYSSMLRRHIVSDSKVAELCQRIYARHKEALDLLFEHRPDLQSEIAQLLQDLVREREEEGLLLDHAIKADMRFAHKAWDACPAQRTGGQEWTKSGRVLLFGFENYEGSLTLKLTIGPGQQEFRERLFDLTRQEPKLFNGGLKTLYPKWTQIYKKPFLTKKDYEKGDTEVILEKVRKEWEHFMTHDFPALCQGLSKVFQGEA